MTELSFTLVQTGKDRSRLVASRGETELGIMTIAGVHAEGLIVEHTLVHEEGRGKGVGEALFEYVLQWARKDRLYVVPVCPFVLSRFDKRADTNDVRATCLLRQNGAVGG